MEGNKNAKEEKSVIIYLNSLRSLIQKQKEFDTINVSKRTFR